MCHAKHEHEHGIASDMTLTCRPCVDERNHDVIESAREAKEANDDETDSGQATRSANEEKTDVTSSDKTTQAQRRRSVQTKEVNTSED